MDSIFIKPWRKVIYFGSNDVLIDIWENEIVVVYLETGFIALTLKKYYKEIYVL